VILQKNSTSKAMPFRTRKSNIINQNQQRKSH